MTTEPEKLKSSAAVAESVNAAALAREATDKAHEAIVREVLAENEKRTEEAFTRALKNVFSREGEGGNDRGMYAAVVRIPLICKDILDMKGDITTINGNITWGVRIVVGAVILGLIGIVTKVWAQ